MGGRSNPYLLSNNLILILLAYSQANILLEPPSWKTMFTNIGNHFSQESSELRKEIKKNAKTSLNLIVNVFRWIICQNWPPWLREEKIGNNLKTSVFSKSTSPRKLPYFPWKSMVGKWFISYWNGLFWGGGHVEFLGYIFSHRFGVMRFLRPEGAPTKTPRHGFKFVEFCVLH